MNQEQYEKVMKTADQVETFVRDTHEKVREVYDKVGDTIDAFVDAFLDGVEKAREDATEKRSKDVWGEATDRPTDATNDAPRRPNSPTVDQQIQEVVERLSKAFAARKDVDPKETADRVRKVVDSIIRNAKRDGSL